MSDFLKVVKVILKDTYRPSKKTKRTGIIVTATIFVLLYLLFESSIVASVVNITPYFKEHAYIPEFLTAIMTFGIAIVTILGIMPMLNLLYFSKDSEFFLSLPIGQSKVYFAKLFTVYITQLLITALIVLPALFAVGILAGLSWVFFPVMIFATLFVPCFPLMIISIICLPIMYVIRFFKNRGAAASVFAIVLFVALFAIYMVVINVSEGDATGEDIAAGLLNPVLNSAKVFLPLHAINKFATFTAIEGYSPALSMLFNFLIFVVPAFMLFIVALIISRKAYYGAVASQLENSGRVHGGSLYKSGMSGFKAQIVREWKLIWRTPVFAIQCFGTLIIAPIILIVMGVGINGVGASPNKSMFVTIWLIIGALMQFLIVSTNIGASTTFSRDGEAFFINKLIPMSYNTLIKAKITLYNLIYDVAIVISTAIWYILFGLKFWWMGLLILAYLIIYNYGFVSMCILIDLSSPKLDWRSYREIVKNSRNAFLPILIGGAVSLLVGAASIGLIFILRDLMSIELASALVSTLMLGGAIAFAFITRNILSTNAARYFDRIEA